MQNSKTLDGCSLIAGGAGFIGHELIGRLLSEGQRLLVIDNLSRGKISHVDKFMSSSNFHFLKADVAVREECEEVFKYANNLGGVSEIWHLAANSDIPAGIKNPDIDLKDTFLSTFELLRAANINGVKSFHFASSSAIYGDLGPKLLREDVGPLLPISNYGAMKLASEAQLSAAGESFMERINIFRFPNVVGVPATHGVILDFINKLIDTPNYLQVLGDGSQQKSYLHVSDLVCAMLRVVRAPSEEKIRLVNIGPLDEGVTVSWIAEQVTKRVSPGAKIKCGVGNKGWVGDVPKFNYSTERLQSYGWSPALGSASAVIRAINEIALQLGR